MVLERLALPAFDMSKLVGTFVRHIPADPVPRELKRHLFAIEEKILEAQVRPSPLCRPLTGAVEGAEPAAREQYVLVAIWLAYTRST